MLSKVSLKIDNPQWRQTFATEQDSKALRVVEGYSLSGFLFFIPFTLWRLINFFKTGSDEDLNYFYSNGLKVLVFISYYCISKLIPIFRPYTGVTSIAIFFISFPLLEVEKSEDSFIIC
jgi:hypothetical protein